MMLPIPDIAPKSQEEYDYLIDATYQNGLEQYEIDKAKIQEQAEQHWTEQADIIRERLIALLEASLNVEQVNTLDGLRLLTEAEWKTKWNAGLKAIDAKLAQEKEQYIHGAVSLIPMPPSKKDIDQMYSCYKDMWVHPEVDDGYLRGDMGYELLTIEEVRIAQITKVDTQTSENIKAGFEYALEGEQPLYYSLSEIDQINFANYANAAILLSQSGKEGKISWQAWDKPDHVKGDMPVQVDFPPEDFISLYTQGALAHIQNCLSQGRAVKYQILAASTKEEVASLNVEPSQILKAKNG